MLRAYSVTRLLGVGPEMGSRAGDFSGLKATFYESTAALLENLPTLHFEREDILIKGARTFTFEAITERLEEKTHETALEIDLNRITDNLNQLRNLLNPGTRVMAMVKAFAYGTGSYEVARLLEHHRVDYLAVAYADEGVALRKAGIHLPILVLNPEHTAYPAMIEHRLEPQLYNFRTVHHFAKALEHAAVGVRYPVHIKVNTGMNRLGFDPENLTDLVALLKNAELAMEVRSVFSHLAASEDPGSDTLTKLQIERFRHAAAYIETGIGYPFMKHILNSGGAMRHPEAQMDMVRLGIALYGISSHPDARSTLKPAGTLVTTISQLRNVPAGEGVGYAPRTPLSEARTIAVLPIGYADGLPRAMGNGAWKVYIHGQPAPTVGHICMDMCMVDVTHLKCNEGDRVEVLGEQATIYEMARVLNTIPYEILTHISPRVKRVYLHE
jgi:alanine racemase